MIGLKKRDIKKALKAGAKASGVSLADVRAKMCIRDRNIADHIDSFTDYDFAHLLFSDGTVENAISLDLSLIHI